MRTLLLLLLLTCTSYGQVHYQGWYNGKYYNNIYDWNSLCCSNPDCAMRKDIINRLQAQRTIPVTTPTPQQAYTTYETVTRQVPYQVCVGKDRRGRCIFETRYRTETSQVPVTKYRPTPAPMLPGPTKLPLTVSPSQAPTPIQAVEFGLLVADLSPDDILVEPGCGDGRWLKVAKEKYNIRLAIGIEKDKGIAKRARQNTDAIIIEGDATEFDYSSATVVVMYIYQKLMAEIVPKLPSGTKIISYMHEIPYVENKKYVLNEHVVFVGITK